MGFSFWVLEFWQLGLSSVPWLGVLSVGAREKPDGRHDCLSGLGFRVLGLGCWV